MRILKKIILVCVVSFLVSSCSTRYLTSFKPDQARIGENTTPRDTILDTITPVKPIVVGVYKFRDQTGQYKQVENGSSWSTAITQGTTTMLLKALEDSKWFRPIERENVSNLLNERQIIRSTRQQYQGDSQDNSLPPLLFAGIILEGGVISYDSNIRTGGVGLRYFGTGGSSQYREDRITVYLRAVSTSTGEILKTIYVSKTILSQTISANVFKYVDVKKILEAEVGITQNEPKQLAVKEAIDKSVRDLIIEGIIDGLWTLQGHPKFVQVETERIKASYKKEQEIAERTKLYNVEKYDGRKKQAFGIEAGAAKMSADYSGQESRYSFRGNYKMMFNNPKFNLNIGAGVFKFGQVQKSVFRFNHMLTFDTNLEYLMIPNEKFSPYLYAGLGTVSDLDFEKLFLKSSLGGGVEYLATDNIGIRLYAENNIAFSDKLDGIVHGKRDDHFWRYGIGLNFYFGD